MENLQEILEGGTRKNFVRFVNGRNADNYIKGLDFAREVKDKYTPVYGFWLNTNGKYGTQAVIVTNEYLINGNSVADPENAVGITGKLMKINSNTELYNSFAHFCNSCQMYLKAEIAENSRGQEYSVLKLKILESQPEDIYGKWCTLDTEETEADPDLPF